MDNTKAGRHKAGLPVREKRRGDESKNEISLFQSQRRRNRRYEKKERYKPIK